MLSSLARLDRDELARRHIESAEAWMRRVIHDRMTVAHGPDYVSTPGVLPAKIRNNLAAQLAAHPDKFLRTVDATSIEQAIEILVNPDLYQRHFRDLLNAAFPDGREEARTFLHRIRDIRNDISHGRGCSLRSLERAICYSNDLIESFVSYYRGLGMSSDYDVPLIIRYSDNIGNDSHLIDVPLNVSQRFIDMRRGAHGDLRPGDQLVAEVEVDSSFHGASYVVRSCVYGRYDEGDSTLRISIDETHVGEQLEIIFEVKTDRTWHRASSVDDRLGIIYRVLPPVL